MLRTAVAIFLISGVPSFTQSYPSARITNGVLSAELYLPDAAAGYYRATRFDWSGIIRSLTYQGHNYFGQWYDVHDPLTHDAITGPVNIFASVGESFLRIGVGHVERPDADPYRETKTYKIIDPGKWRVDREPDLIRFTHELGARNGYSYIYVKTIFFPPGKPEMILSQELTNTGSKPIDTAVFNHGFFQIDSEPAGPGLIWTLPFAPHTTGDFNGMAQIRDHQIAYLRELMPGERALAPLTGYGDSARDHRLVVENLKTGAGVRVRGDRPITKLTFWSRRMAYSPEATIRLHAAPGETEKWQTSYEFYVVPVKEKTR